MQRATLTYLLAHLVGYLLLIINLPLPRGIMVTTSTDAVLQLSDDPMLLDRYLCSRKMQFLDVDVLQRQHFREVRVSKHALMTIISLVAHFEDRCFSLSPHDIG